MALEQDMSCSPNMRSSDLLNITDLQQNHSTLNGHNGHNAYNKPISNTTDITSMSQLNSTRIIYKPLSQFNIQHQNINRSHSNIGYNSLSTKSATSSKPKFTFSNINNNNNNKMPPTVHKFGRGYKSMSPRLTQNNEKTLTQISLSNKLYPSRSKSNANILDHNGNFPPNKYERKIISRRRSAALEIRYNKQHIMNPMSTNDINTDKILEEFSNKDSNNNNINTKKGDHFTKKSIKSDKEDRKEKLRKRRASSKRKSVETDKLRQQQTKYKRTQRKKGEIMRNRKSTTTKDVVMFPTKSSKNKSNTRHSKKLKKRTSRRRIESVASPKKQKDPKDKKKKLKKSAQKRENIKVSPKKSKDVKKKNLKVKRIENSRIRKKSKSAQQVLRETKQMNNEARPTKKGAKPRMSRTKSNNVQNNKQRRKPSIASQQRKQRLQKAKLQIKTAQSNRTIGKEHGLKERKQRKKNKEKAYKKRTSEALKSAKLAKIELSSAVSIALKQLRPVQRRKIEQEIKKQLQDEKNMILKMQKEIESTKEINQREQEIIKQKFEKEQSRYRKEKEQLMAEKKALKDHNERVVSMRKELEQKKKTMNAESKKHELMMDDRKKRLDKTQQTTQQKKLQLLEEKEIIKKKEREQNVKEMTLKRQQEEIERNTEKLENDDIRAQELDKEINGIHEQMEELKQLLENKNNELIQIRNKNDEINIIKSVEMNNKEEQLDRKRNKEFDRAFRRLSHDLSSEASKIATELNTYKEIDQHLKFDDMMLGMLDREKKDLDENYKEMEKKIKQFDQIKKSISVPTPSPSISPLPTATNTVPVSLLNKAPIPAPLPPSAPIPSAPKPSAPITSVPIPSAPIPSAPIPSASIPSASIPSASIPSAPIPSAPIPSAPIPSAPIPSTSMPAAPIPPLPSIQGVPLPPLPAAPLLSISGAPPPIPAANCPPLDVLLPIPSFPAMKKQAPAPSGRAPPKDVKMRRIQWKKLKGETLKKSIFKDIKVNDDDIKLDFGLLDRLWCEPKKTEKGKKGKKPKLEKSKERRLNSIEFLDEIDDDGKKAQSINITIKAIKKRAEQYRDIILTMEFAKNDKCEHIVAAINEIVPNEVDMNKFNAIFKRKKYELNDVKYFAEGERLWYYCRKIPFVSLRCKLWMFRMQFDELCNDQYKHINLLQLTYIEIDKNREMMKIFELVLAIGNYLNYGHKRNGGAQGIKLDIFDKLRDLKANRACNDDEKEDIDKYTDKYTLLMYLVDMVSKQYPELSNWIKIFNHCKSCIKIKMDELEKEINSIDKEVKNLKIQLKKMKEERIKLEEEENKKLKRRKGKKSKKGKKDTDDEEKEEDEIWEPPSSPSDAYNSVMTKFVEKAEKESIKLITAFKKTKTNCNDLAAAMGEKLTDKYTLCNFWETLDNIKKIWIEAQNALEKIKKNKAKSKSKGKGKGKKKSIKSKSRSSKHVLTQKTVTDKYGQIALQNVMNKQIEREQKLCNGSNNGNDGRLTRHSSIYLAQKRYKCAHCDVIMQDVANLSVTNMHCHQCYSSPHDKKINNLSLQWLSVNRKSTKCQFNHSGPCFFVYTAQNKKCHSSQEKKTMLLKSKHFETADAFNISSSKDINYEDMIDRNTLIDGQHLIHSLDEKHEEQIYKKWGENLKNWHKYFENNNDENKNDDEFYNKSVWNQILSSDSSESDDNININYIIHSDKLRLKKGKKSNKTREIYEKRKKKKKKKKKSIRSNSERVLFKRLNDENKHLKIPQFNFRKKRDSIFLMDDDLNELNRNELNNNNTIERE